MACAAQILTKLAPRVAGFDSGSEGICLGNAQASSSKGEME
jgi:hypothetical protein